MSQVTAVDIVDGAIKLLKENEWTRGALARNYDGDEVEFYSKNACAFCVLGAIDRAHVELNNMSLNSVAAVEIRIAARLVTGGYYISPWNDNICKSKEEAINFLENVKAVL